MKTILLFALAACALSVTAQVPTYTNSAPPPLPGSSSIAVPPYNSGNPTGQPSVNDPYPTVKPVPATTVSPGPSPTPTPALSPTVPNASPTWPAGTYTPKTNRLFQDPTRTPDNPKLSHPVNTVDGSRGKYRKKHKTVTGKKFGKSYHKMKTAKPPKKEKAKKESKESKG